ncbi:MAG: hypothetical protein GVY16_03585 [Planctomycetes bacterium]|jgi:hypothetical protein|nr:hypothetical protein [Planctomycetota bacterium]
MRVGFLVGVPQSRLTFSTNYLTNVLFSGSSDASLAHVYNGTTKLLTNLGTPGETTFGGPVG